MRFTPSYQLPVAPETFPKILGQMRPGYKGQPPRLLDQIREVFRRKHYSLRTEEVYVDWARRFVRFCGLRHPRDCGAAEVEAFLTHLATQGLVSASTQNQARSALLFLYKEVLGSELPWLENVESAKRPSRLPVVLTEAEVRQVLAGTQGTSGLVLRLLYGTQDAGDGMPAAAREGRGIRPARDHHPRGQGVPRPRDDAAGLARR